MMTNKQNLEKDINVPSKEIQERELLYQGLDWCVSVDGIFHNPKEIPYRNCIYELALACRDKSEQLQRKEQECERLKKALEDIETICVEQNLKYDTTACEVLDVIEKFYEGIIDEQ